MLTTSFDVLIDKEIVTHLGCGVFHVVPATLLFEATIIGDEDGWGVQSIALRLDGHLQAPDYSGRYVEIDDGSPLYLEALAEIERRRDRHDEDWALFLADEGIAPFDPNAEYGTLDAKAL